MTTMLRPIFLLLPFLWLTACTSERSLWVARAMEIPSTPPVPYDKASPLSPVLQAERMGHPFYLTAVQTRIDELSASVLSAGNRLELLPDWHSSVKKGALADIAKESILISSLQLVCDEGGQELVNHLIGAARRGVVVRIVLDGGIWGSMGSGSCFKQLKRAGALVRRSPYYLLPGAKNFQLHDKIFVVDASYGITGGQNMGSWWAKSNGINGYFRDTDIFAEGPVVLDMAKRALAIWLQSQPRDSFTDQYEKILKQKQNTLNWLSAQSARSIHRFLITQCLNWRPREFTNTPTTYH